MFFYLSKIFVYLLNPLLWILVLLLTAIISRKNKPNKPLLISFILLLLLSNPFLVDRFAQVWDIKTGPVNKNKVYSCAIVLGGFSSEGDNGKGFFNESADRFIQALKLKKNNQVSHLLVLGGNSEMVPGRFRESIWVREQLMELQVPDSNILVDGDSRNTFENAVNAKNILRYNNLKPPYLLITSAFHMRRSLFSFQKQGIDVIPYPSNYLAGKGKISFADFIPQAAVLSKWATYFKEVIGFGIYYVKG